MKIVAAGHIGRSDPETEDLRPARAAPAEGLRRQSHLIFVGTVEDITPVSDFVQQVRQRGRMAEGVDVVADLRTDAEAVLEVTLPQFDLLAPAGRGWQVRIRLDPLPARDRPAPRFHQLADRSKKPGIEIFDPLVEPGLTARVAELGILMTAIDRRAERGKRFINSSLPVP